MVLRRRGADRPNLHTEVVNGGTKEEEVTLADSLEAGEMEDPDASEIRVSAVSFPETASQGMPHLRQL